MKNALVASALAKAAMLRRTLGQETVASLDSLTNHANELVALVAKKELVIAQLHQGDVDQAQAILERMKSEYAGRDSIGHLSVVSIIQSFDRMIERIRETGKAATPTHTY